MKVLDGTSGELIDGPLSSFLAFGSEATGGVFVGGGVAPQMGQCVGISSRSSAGEPMLTKTIQFP